MVIVIPTKINREHIKAKSQLGISGRQNQERALWLKLHLAIKAKQIVVVVLRFTQKVGITNKYSSYAGN
jgi:hypothetical protein